MKREVIQTADGSTTIYLPEWNEHYHSSHGALQEAQHVFIQNGLLQTTADYLTILEMGFGTGLNALLTYFASEKRNQYIHYQGIEAFPPSVDEIQAMNYATHAKDPETASIYQALHQAPWNQPIGISEHFVIEKIQRKIDELELPTGSIDLCYYDAFGPRVQPELWTTKIFQQLYSWMAEGGILVTYCAKGQVKRDLAACGFQVQTLEGPPGKREMIQAIKK
jgi:tRNA U34 5-methylaminomethyl-2-thiouridine-forming methyltransferase MnmC